MWPLPGRAELALALVPSTARSTIQSRLRPPGRLPPDRDVIGPTRRRLPLAAAAAPSRRQTPLPGFRYPDPATLILLALSWYRDTYLCLSHGGTSLSLAGWCCPRARVLRTTAIFGSRRRPRSSIITFPSAVRARSTAGD